MAYNKEHYRHGSLFQKGFKRIKVDDERYLIWLIHYIHHNPVHHRITNDFGDWKYSSYNALVSTKQTKIARNETISFFGDLEDLIQFHRENKNYNIIKKHCEC